VESRRILESRVGSSLGVLLLFLRLHHPRRVLDKEEVKDDEDAEEEEEEEERKATTTTTTTTTTLLDERLKNVFGGIDKTTIVRDLPFAFGGSFLDKNEKDETALTTGDDEAYEGTGGEDVEEVPKKKKTWTKK